jgi:hypothetical protein
METIFEHVGALDVRCVLVNATDPAVDQTASGGSGGGLVLVGVASLRRPVKGTAARLALLGPVGLPLTGRPRCADGVGQAGSGAARGVRGDHVGSLR